MPGLKLQRNCLLAALAIAALTSAQNPEQGVPETAPTQVSEHVYALVGWPNVGIVVGNRATLVIDTGMGAQNGAIVARQAEKLAKSPNLYLTTTHFHPEHAMGVQAFPPRTVLIRPAVQQEEMEKRGNEFIELFRGRSPKFKEMLSDVKLRPPDILFDRELKLDLGGVTARLMWFGPGHTKGDELIFIEPDSVLLPGDIVENKLIPTMPNADASPKGWLNTLDRIEPLHPRFIVPDHGQLGDGSLIAQERAFILDVQGRALELKRQGVPLEDAAKQMVAEFKAKYPGWEPVNGIANLTRRVYAEN